PKQLEIACIDSDPDPYPLPKNLQGEAMWRWQMEYAESDAGREWLANQSRYLLDVHPDGSFLVPEISPGKYRLFINLYEGSLGSGPGSAHPLYRRQVGSMWRKFEVPANGSPVDLGNLVLNPSP